MDVTDIIRDRMAPPAGLQKMITASLVAHAMLGAILVLAPTNLFGRRADEPKILMNISLGGAGEGPPNGGRNPAAAPPVQAPPAPVEPTKREPVRPPAAKTPEMVLPTKATAKASKTPAPVVRQAPDDARGRTPTRGAQPSAGNAVTYTGARGQGFGLATGGGPGTGSRLDVTDFCCPDYVTTMVERIRSAWQSQQGASGDVMIRFVIQRDGRITDYSIEQSSGTTVLDTAALRAVALTRTLNPLPAQFTGATLPVHLNFQYR